MKVADDFDAPLPPALLAVFQGLETRSVRSDEMPAGPSVFLWALAIPSKLNRQARDLLSNQREGLYLVRRQPLGNQLKFGLGKRNTRNTGKVRSKVDVELGHSRFDISHLHALAVGDLPLHHQDPFDRILIVQAVTEGRCC